MLETESLIGSVKSELFGQLLNSIDQQFGDGVDVPLFQEWVKHVVLDTKPFTYNRHEYLIEPYQDDHPFQVEMKAAQMGLTTRAMLRALYKCRYAGFRGVLYLFPSRTDALIFPKAGYQTLSMRIRILSENGLGTQTVRA